MTERAIIAAARESVENGGSQDLFAGAESESSAKSTAQNKKVGAVSTDSRGQKEDRVSSQERQGEAVKVKKAITELAGKAWSDKDYNGKVSFTPSEKFRNKAQELFGHDVKEVFITLL